MRIITEKTFSTWPKNKTKPKKTKKNSVKNCTAFAFANLKKKLFFSEEQFYYNRCFRKRRIPADYSHNKPGYKWKNNS